MSRLLFRGGVSGHCLICPSGILPPKLRHILGILAFSEKISVKIYTLPRSNHLLKIQWEIHLLTFWHIDRNSSKKIQNRICTLLFQICFGINFGRREVVKLKIYKYAYLRILSLTTSRSQKLIPKIDLQWECPYFYSNFF